MLHISNASWIATNQDIRVIFVAHIRLYTRTSYEGS